MRIAILAVGLCCGMAWGQPATLIDHTSPGARAAIGAQLAAGQVLSELRLLAISAHAQPPNVQQELQRRCNVAAGLITQMYQLVRLGVTWEAVQVEWTRANQALLETAVYVRQVAGNDRNLLFALSRVEFSWQRTTIQLAQAFAGFQPINPNLPVTGPAQQYLLNLTRGLSRQADVLIQIAQATLPRDAFSLSLERLIREFAVACDHLTGAVERGVPFAPQLAEVQTRWDMLVRMVGGIQLHQHVAVRLQAARVNQLYVALLRAVSVQAPPAFIFPINNLKSAGVIAVGSGEGGPPTVRVFGDRRGRDFHDFMAYDPQYKGGVRVAVADVNGDGVVDVVTAPGPGMPPLVRVFDGRDLSLASQFYAYDQKFQSGVFVAAADVTGNGRAEIVCGAGDPGGPHVRAFDGMTGQLKAEFYAYDQRLQCGVRVALGDVNGDGVPDIVTAPGPGVEPVIKVYNGRGLAQLASFQAYEPAFHGGAFVAAADVLRTGRAVVITGAGANGGPHVRLFDPLAGRMLQEFYAYDRSFLGGVRLAVCDAVGDGLPDIITAPGAGIAPIIRIFRNRDGQLDREFDAFDPLFRGGAWVAGN